MLLSEEQLNAMEVAFAPKVKAEKRKEIIQKYKTKIRTLIDRTQGKRATVEDLARAFARMRMNG